MKACIKCFSNISNVLVYFKKPIPLNTFRDCISKRLKPEVGRRTREGGSKIRYYTFGNNPQQVIEYLKQNGLYNENL